MKLKHEYGKFTMCMFSFEKIISCANTIELCIKSNHMLQPKDEMIPWPISYELAMIVTKFNFDAKNYDAIVTNIILEQCNGGKGKMSFDSPKSNEIFEQKYKKYDSYLFNYYILLMKVVFFLNIFNSLPPCAFVILVA